jgi:hypothetical protein
MKTLVALFAFSAAAVACQAHVNETAPPTAHPDTSVDRPEVKPPPEVGFSGVVRIHAGAWPRSNSHLWGSRLYELRHEDGKAQVRLHDEISFQGVGMKPEQMPPTRHTCTPWESLPQEVAVRANETAAAHRGGFDALVCEEHAATCTALRAWFESTAKPVADTSDPGRISDVESLQMSYGRTSGDCS